MDAPAGSAPCADTSTRPPLGASASMRPVRTIIGFMPLLMSACAGGGSGIGPFTLIASAVAASVPGLAKRCAPGLPGSTGHGMGAPA